MDERDGIRLMEYLDGRLAPDERAEVEAWLLRDPVARAAADEHRRVWELLGQALPVPEVSASESFRRDILARADADAPRRLFARPAALIAAALLVAVVGWAWWSTHPETLSDADRPVVGHLALLEHYDFLQAHGAELDVAVQSELMRHLAGELPKDKDGTGR